MSAREELLALARRHMWAAWQLSSEELASQAAATLFGLGMLVPEGGAAELEKLRAHVAELEAQAPPADADHAKAPWGRGEDGRPLLPMGAHWTDVPELVDRNLAGIQARVDQAQPGSWYRAPASELGVAPGTVRTRVDGYPRVVGQFTNVLPDDLELILHAHADLSWCLEMIGKFRAQVAELEGERHSTNESLSEAAEALRANRDRIAELEARLAEQAEDDDPARCLKTHPFNPRDGWRMVCSNCDHGKDASCHRVETGGAS